MAGLYARCKNDGIAFILAVIRCNDKAILVFFNLLHAFELDACAPFGYLLIELVHKLRAAYLLIGGEVFNARGECYLSAEVFAFKH